MVVGTTPTASHHLAAFPEHLHGPPHPAPPPAGPILASKDPAVAETGGSEDALDLLSLSQRLLLDPERAVGWRVGRWVEGWRAGCRPCWYEVGVQHGEGSWQIRGSLVSAPRSLPTHRSHATHCPPARRQVQEAAAASVAQFAGLLSHEHRRVHLTAVIEELMCNYDGESLRGGQTQHTDVTGGSD